MSADLPAPGCALAFAAHPDDVEFGCGATLSRWAAAGTRLVHAIFTDGAKGTWDPAADLDALVRTRRAEQVAASRALGGDGQVEWFGVVDGELDSGLDGRRWVAEIVRRHRPDVVLGHDPWQRYRLHPDHRHAGWLTVDGVVAARDPHFFPDLGPHHRPRALLLFEADEPNHVESAGLPALEARLAALLAHASQAPTTHFHRLGTGTDPVQGFRARERAKLESMGALAGRELGEAFRLVDLT